jgi:site-specific DNA-methyltransferase (adenine-specific)
MLDFGFYNMDCMEGMKEFPDKYFELAIVDPPYRDAKNNAPTKDMRKKTTNGNMKSFGEKPNSQYFNELFRVSQNQIVWGGNNFIDNLYSTNCFLFWYKQNPMPNYSDGEMAWTSFQTVARCILLPYYGTLNSDFKKIHPTQKPVALYEWLLYNYAKQGDKILDTHVGSASSLIACYNLGFDYVGFELDKDYYDMANKRIAENKAQIRFDNNLEMF